MGGPTGWGGSTGARRFAPRPAPPPRGCPRSSLTSFNSVAMLAVPQGGNLRTSSGRGSSPSCLPTGTWVVRGWTTGRSSRGSCTCCARAVGDKTCPGGTGRTSRRGGGLVAGRTRGSGNGSGRLCSSPWTKWERSSGRERSSTGASSPRRGRTNEGRQRDEADAGDRWKRNPAWSCRLTGELRGDHVGHSHDGAGSCATTAGASPQAPPATDRRQGVRLPRPNSMSTMTPATEATTWCGLRWGEGTRS